MQPNKILFIFILCIFSLPIYSQNRIDVATGLSIDINNKGKFIQAPVSVQWFATNPKRVASFFIFGEVFFPAWGYHGSDSAFSINAQPNAIKLSKTIQNYNFCAGVGLNIKTIKIQNGYLFEEIVGGVSYQKFVLKYKDYDSAIYDILNPDKGLSNGSIFFGLNVGYQKNNWILKLSAQTPPFILRLNEYPVSYNYTAPLQLTIGYSFNLQKHKK